METNTELVVDQKPIEVSAQTQTVSPKVVQFCIDLQEDPSLKKRYLTELKSMDEDTLTEEDLGYLMDQLREFDTIIAYVRSIMARRAGERVEEEEVQAAPKKKRGRPKKKKSKAGKSPMEDLDEEL